MAGTVKSAPRERTESERVWAGFLPAPFPCRPWFCTQVGKQAPPDMCPGAWHLQGPCERVPTWLQGCACCLRHTTTHSGYGPKGVQLGLRLPWVSLSLKVGRLTLTDP